MRNHRPPVIAALAAAALCTAGGAQAAAVTSGDAAAQVRAAVVPPPFRDGSFESPTAPAGAFTTIGLGQNIGPWTVTQGNVDLIGAGYWAAADGDQSVDLNGVTTGAVSQTFATVPGTTYTVSYALAGNTDPDFFPTVKTGMALIDGQDVQDFSFDITGKTHTDMGYVTQHFTFLATKPSTTLTFASTTAGAQGPVIDNVRVHADCCRQACH